MTYAERILDYLWSVSPAGATNGEIASRLGIRSQQTVYLLTQDLRRRGLIRGEQAGRAWVFSAAEAAADGSVRQRAPAFGRAAVASRLSSDEFTRLARSALGSHHEASLSPGVVPGVRKQFDFVSADGQIVGDAMREWPAGLGLANEKFATISERVWLLEKTGAARAFLVFGGDRAVPFRWLERHGRLLTSTTFFFLTEDGQLEILAGLGGGATDSGLQSA